MNHTPLYQQRASLEIEILPFECNDLTDPQAQAPCNQHHGPERLPDLWQQRMELLRCQDPRRFEALGPAQ
jgi:hypothetical protein